MNAVLKTPATGADPEATSAALPKSAMGETVRLLDVQNTPVVLDFEGGSLTSDAGILLLREVEQQIGILKAWAGAIDDPRDARYVKHTIMDLLMQRVSQIASGYEDANDCDQLRDDPVFKMPAGRLPESGPTLAGQPTMSRFENSLSRTYLFRLAYAFADNFIASYAAPRKSSCWILTTPKTRFMAISSWRCLTIISKIIYQRTQTVFEIGPHLLHGFWRQSISSLSAFGGLCSHPCAENECAATYAVGERHHRHLALAAVQNRGAGSAIENPHQSRAAVGVSTENDGAAEF